MAFNHRQASKIRGTKVLSAKGIPVGVIRHTLVNPASGITLFLISCYSSFIGKERWNLAVPGSSVTFDKSRPALCYLDIDARQLLEAPSVSIAKMTGDINLMKSLNTKIGIDPICKLLP